jgi:drug/metabolite transporter (DMT)-like permease
VLSRLFFGEPLTRRKLLGNALILAGVAVFYL